MDLSWTNSTESSSSCPKCFYGNKCQFTTSFFSLTSLDTSIDFINHLTSFFLLSFYLFGTVGNFLTFRTFCQSVTREMGTGIYRLWLSIVAQLCLTFVLLHFMLQKHRRWTTFNCNVFEYLEKVLHSLYDSLVACTTIERTVMVYQGLSFSKLDSRRVSKFVVLILTIYHFVSILYEPFYRQNVDSTCSFDYSDHSFQNYQITTNLLHFILPYAMNIFLPLIWLTILTKNKSRLKPNESIRSNLFRAIKSYKFTLISVFLIVLFNTPRFISMFVLKCVENSLENHFYSISFFLSFVPMFFNVFLFVFPSPKYRPELIRLVQRHS